MARLLERTEPSAGPATAAGHCPSCGGDERVGFLDLTGMPVFNNVLWPDPAAASSAATGDINLAICCGCGLISNTAFDADLVHYGPAYENSLHGSATFQEFAGQLAQRLAADHHLAGGHVLEVGAGSGEFLAMLCHTAGCTGAGFDPSHDQSDQRADRSRSRVAAGTLPAAHTIAADLVVCRHVLEHVNDPVGLLRAIATAVHPRTARQAVPIYVEVPDAQHMLDEDAFWDVIYEHPLYFDRGALARTFVAAGYDVTRSGRAFASQFAWMEGVPAADPPPPTPTPARDDAAERVTAALTFGERFRTRIAEHQARLERARRGGLVALWGAGSKGVTMANLVPAARDALIVDVSVRKQGKRLPCTGQVVLAPEELAGCDLSLVVVMNPVYVEEVRQELTRLGVRADLAVA